MKPLIVLAGLLGLTAGAAWAQVPELYLTLDQAEQQTLETSPQLQGKVLELEAAKARADSYYGLLWPRLSLEAAWRYVTEVPSIQLPGPSAPEIALGDHVSYSVGPMISWNIWDSGGSYYAWQAVQAGLRAQEQELEGLRRELRLRVRLAYFQTQLAASQVGLLADALQLALAQYRDIRAQLRAGASSRIDALSSHQDVLNDLRQLRRARNDLGAAAHDLLGLTGSGLDLDLSLPVGADLVGRLPEQAEPPTVAIRMDPLPESLRRLEGAASAELDPDYPRVRQFLELAASARQAAAGLSAGHWPQIQIYGKTSLDYPNGPVLETIHQNTAGVNASWSLWEGGRVVNQVSVQERTALASEQYGAQAQRDLIQTWQKTRDRLGQLRAEQDLNGQAVAETDELAGLVYAAYRAGRANYLEVQSANYRALSAKVQQALTQAQMLIQLATLDSLSEPQQNDEAGGRGR